MISDIVVEIDKKDFVPMDGNTSAAYVAYANTEVSFIYPISPATSMGEAMDTFSAAGKTNCISHQTVRVEVMQSEGGAAGAVHGALTAGALSSTFTASQGLLLMIPNMYLIAGELMPCVMHVSARTLAKQALCIYNDHSDVMAVRQTGWALLCSNSPQEVMDLALVSHLATVKARVPVLHFFDGNRTSHSIQKIHRIPYEDMEQLIRLDLIDENLRRVALNPNIPSARGTGQRPDIFFQSNMASERFYRACPRHIEETMQEVERVTGRRYNLFDYFGHPDAQFVVVVMGSAGNTTQQFVRGAIDADNAKFGVIKVRCYRPWSVQHFLASLPATVQRIAVLDRTREEGALGNPLFLDVAVTLKESGVKEFEQVLVTGGSAGIGQKEVTPSMIEAVFANLESSAPKTRYTVGIEDDVTFTSLPYNTDKRSNDASLPRSIRQCLFWGLGSDGTVGANKEAIKMIGDHTELNCQGFFAYDSKKSGGVTLSQLRFGADAIEAEYQITSADYIAVHNCSNQFINKLNLLQAIKHHGIFVLNSPWSTLAEMEAQLPARMKRQIAEHEVQFYNIDAGRIAREAGLKGRINMIMQSVFYKLGDVIPSEEATSLLKSSIKRMFGKKGEEIVNMNLGAVDQAGAALQRVEYPRAEWLNAVDAAHEIDAWDHLLYAGVPDFVSHIMEPCMNWEGDSLPVSAFEPGGVFPVGTTRYERRGAAPEIPVWLADKCTQCNYCSIVCPHAVIRPFLLSKEESKLSPDGYLYRKAQGGGDLAGLNYSIQVAAMDCTGCAVCVESCPDEALFMGEFAQYAPNSLHTFEYSMTLPLRQPIDKFSVKGSQFEQPLLEFHGACAGCGETPYVKLVTQLFGQQMMIANASGCSSVWGGTCTTHPYTVNKETGHGPAWGRSLFEDNAEYGFGMCLASLQRRKRLYMAVQSVVDNVSEDTVSNPRLLKLFRAWLKTYSEFAANNAICDELDRLQIVSECQADHPLIYACFKQRDMFRSQSQWLIGGDGWAYDIGSGGLDHILSKGENINVLILDTEIYSNTGGQSSKASVAGQVTKFESMGKTRQKKELGASAMAYGDVYVASVSLGADYAQTVKALKEAAEYPGTSVIMAYSPCIDWGIDTKDMASIQRIAVETGYWELYRFDPRLARKGSNAMQLDSRRIKKPIKKYLESENRFRSLQRQHKERAEALQGSLEDWITSRHDKLLRQSMDDLELLDFLKEQLGVASGGAGEDEDEKFLILYGSETGNAAEFSRIVATDLQRRGVRRVKVMACDDYDWAQLARERNVLLIVATCGQGEMPGNCKELFAQLSEAGEDDVPDLSGVNVAVFGMGDSHYVYFNEAAKKYDDLFRTRLHANMLSDSYGCGDDQEDEKYESAWQEFGPSLFTRLSLPEPERILLPASYGVEFDDRAIAVQEIEHDVIVPSGARLVPMTQNRLLTPSDYDRDTRHYEFETGDANMHYEVGDSLGVYAHNESGRVSEFCAWYGLNENDVIRLEAKAGEQELPAVMTIAQLFTQVLDLFGRPKRRFYELLSLVATDDAERGELMHLSNEQFAANTRETLTHADLLRRYASARPSLEHMIDYIPRIKPRLYSIASSPQEQPHEIALCVVVDDWTTPSGQYRRGLCSDYLSRQQPAQLHRVLAKVNAGVVSMPEAHSPPLVMAGLGTGIAPLRSMVRDRAFSIAHNVDGAASTAGPMALYFGARYRKSEFLYEQEWLDLHDDGRGPLTHLSTAFSRDQAHKIYIQDKIAKDAPLIYDYLVTQNGYFYACGSSAVQDLRHTVAKCIAHEGKMSEADAEQYVTNMMIEGRYCIESW
eukprot:CAMPEP_0202688700 /NCGR_PEP_ID=MMETSP1385-20130828/4170_1 /ASSEMBLY_ACC=CAM_ASM_000861 /TAXON_ID=933848 /ORGANISM="Elphidium margaritaceum" /LENGTH=1808 /DNA_ID=CAMNT_0049343729 /DNA_START=509 /DNA_END=5935 /DNA_ORIENTATION=-